MDYATVFTAVRELPHDDQCRLVRELQSSLDQETGETRKLDDDETNRLLDERIVDCEAHPNDVVTLDEALAEIRAKLRT